MPAVNYHIEEDSLKNKIQQNFKDLFLFLKSALTLNCHILRLHCERPVTRIAKQIAVILVNHCISTAQLRGVPEAPLHSIALEIRGGPVFIHDCHIISSFAEAEVHEEHPLSLLFCMTKCPENTQGMWGVQCLYQ